MDGRRFGDGEPGQRRHSARFDTSCQGVILSLFFPGREGKIVF